jgi:acetylornithine deacetylase
LEIYFCNCRRTYRNANGNCGKRIDGGRCEASGTSSHAAHFNDDNAIYNALKDIEWIKNYQFPNTSEVLGDVKMTVTVINAGKLHNMVPNTCTFTIDVRTTDQYSNREVLKSSEKI